MAVEIGAVNATTPSTQAEIFSVAFVREPRIRPSSRFLRHDEDNGASLVGNQVTIAVTDLHASEIGLTYSLLMRNNLSIAC